MEYNITRLEEYTDRTFVRVDAPNVNVERWVQKDEDLDKAIAEMVVQLQARFDDYVAPEAPTIRPVEDREAIKAKVTSKALTDARKRLEKEDELHELQSDE